VTARVGPRSDDGFTLVELLVAMAVLSVVLVIVANLFVAVSNTTRSATASRNAVGQASNAMDELARVVRLGTPLPVAGSSAPAAAVVSGSATALTVLSYVDTSATAPMPTQVAFELVSGALRETRTATTASGSYAVVNGPVTTRTVASGLASVAFAYSDSDGQPIVIAPGASGLSDDQRTAVATITITITAANTTAGTSDPIVLTSSVLLINAALSNGSGS